MRYTTMRKGLKNHRKEERQLYATSINADVTIGVKIPISPRPVGEIIILRRDKEC